MHRTIKLRILVAWKLQTTTPFFDGAAYVSQCPINPGETFTSIMDISACSEREGSSGL